MFYEIPEKIANLEQVREIKWMKAAKVYITRVQGVRCLLTSTTGVFINRCH